MPGDGAQRLDDLGLDQVAWHEHEQVGEVAPTRARPPPMECRHQLLGHDHHLRVGEYLDGLFSEKHRNGGSYRRWDDWITNVEVHAELDARGCEARFERGEACLQFGIARGLLCQRLAGCGIHGSEQRLLRLRLRLGLRKPERQSGRQDQCRASEFFHWYTISTRRFICQDSSS